MARIDLQSIPHNVPVAGITPHDVVMRLIPSADLVDATRAVAGESFRKASVMSEPVRRRPGIADNERI